MTASKPASATTSAISRASVATTSRSHTASSAMRRVTTTIRGSPPSGRSGLRGSRLEPSRAGITPRTGTEEDTKSVPLSLPRPRPLALLPLPHLPLEHVFGCPVPVHIPETGLYGPPRHGPPRKPDRAFVARAVGVVHQRVTPECHGGRETHTRLARRLGHEYRGPVAIDGQRGADDANGCQYILTDTGIGGEDHLEPRQFPRSRQLVERECRRAGAVRACDDSQSGEG